MRRTFTHMATFENNQWKSYDIVNAGGWFPKTRAGTTEPEPQYAGGIVLDHETPNTVYLSVKRDSIFEIEQWTTENSGKSWKIQKITENSTKDNVRPFAVRGATKGNPLQVLWLQNTNYIYYAHDIRGKGLALDFKDRYHTAVKMNLQKPTVNLELTKTNITALLRQIAERLLENPKHDLSKKKWDYGVYHAGIAAFYDLTKEERYKNELLNIEQYQTEENEDSDEDFIRILDLIWSPSAKNDRTALQKIEMLTENSLRAYRIDLEYASFLYVLRNFENTVLEISPLKKHFIEMSQRVAAELNTEAFKTERFTRQKFLLIYGLAAGINDGLIDKKYTENVLKAWKESQSEIFKEGKVFIMGIETSAAVLLAGKEVLEMLNAKR